MSPRLRSLLGLVTLLGGLAAPAAARGEEPTPGAAAAPSASAPPEKGPDKPEAEKTEKGPAEKAEKGPPAKAEKAEKGPPAKAEKKDPKEAAAREAKEKAAKAKEAKEKAKEAKEKAAKEAKEKAAKLAKEKAEKKKREARKRFTSKHLVVKTRELRLAEPAQKALESIAESFHKATKTKLIATGGTRTPLRQAQLMYAKLRKKGDGGAVYEQGAAFAEIKKAFEDGRAGKQPRAKTEKAMAQVIEKQVARGVFISHHLEEGAVDLRSWGITASQEAALRSAVAAAGATLIDERKGPEPHFHLSLAP